jgi:multiple sugar transport system permease protein
VRHVTAPLLVPFAVIIGLIVGVGNLQVFAFLQALTGGGPYFASETVELYIFRWAFGTQSGGVASGQPEFGYASAVGVFFGVLIMAAVAAQAISVARLRPNAAGVGVAR